MPGPAQPRIPGQRWYGDKPLAVRRRLALLAALGALGSLKSLPFLAAGSGKPMTELLAFPVLVTVVAAWPGLRAADAAGLPMPWLRRLDGGPASSIPARSP
jgi:hypothetical protein